MRSSELQEFQTNPKFEGAKATLSYVLDLCAKNWDINFPEVQAAANLMVQAHMGQKDRPDGQPYVSHPPSVTKTAYEKFGVRSTEGVIASLLHDAPEDQAEKIIRLLGGSTTAQNPTAEALRLIGEKFGKRVEEIDTLLTNPDFDELVSKAQLSGDTRESSVIKNELYKEHFMQILEKDVEAFLIKLADFSENGLSLSNLEEGPKKDKLRAKYGPVILAILDKLGEIPEEGHALSELKNNFSQDLLTAYERDYAK